MKLNASIGFFFLIFFISYFNLACKNNNSQQASVDIIDNQKSNNWDTAYFASGCFWCSEAIFERVKGVINVVSGYTGGKKPNPTYEQVSAGNTNHAEAIMIVFDTTFVSYNNLLRFFFASHDPTQLNRQGPDIGKQYRSEIYYRSASQKMLATEFKKQLTNSGKYLKKIKTLITPFEKFYLAENYHQDYYQNHPNNPYVISVSKPKVDKFVKEFKTYLKEKFQ